MECLSVVYLYQRILLIAEPIWFSFTVKFLIGPWKVYNYFGKGTSTFSRKITTGTTHSKFFFFFLKLKCNVVIFFYGIFPLGRRVLVPCPIIIINLSKTYEKLHRKAESYRFSGQRDPSVQTNTDPITLLQGFELTIQIHSHEKHFNGRILGIENCILKT